MANRILFYLCVFFVAVNIAAFLANLYVVFFDTPIGFTYPGLYLSPVSAVVAAVGAIYFKRQIIK